MASDTPESGASEPDDVDSYETDLGEDDGGPGTLILPYVPVGWCRQTGGTTYYVAPDGSDSSPGTQTRPFRTIQHGVETAQAGDTVYVRAGTYHELVWILDSGTKCAPITIAGYPDDVAAGRRPIIDGEYILPTGPYAVVDPETGKGFVYAPLVKVVGDYIVFEGFEVMRSRGRGILVTPGGHNAVRNCWIHECRNAGIRGIDSDYLVVEYNRIWDTTNYATYDRPPHSGLPWPGALTMDETDHSVVRGNEIFYNWSQGIHVMQMDHILVEDNVVYDNLNAQLQVDTCGHATVRRNFVYYTGVAPFTRDSAPGGLGVVTDHKFSGRLTDQTIVNNIVVGNRVNFNFWAADPPRGALINALVAYNTFVNAASSDASEAYGVWIKPHPEHENVRFENNIVVQDTPGTMIRVPEDEEFAFDHNLWSEAPPDSTSSPDDVIGDPLFVNGDAELRPGQVPPEWFKLQPSSPAIHAAKDITEVTRDFWRNARDLQPDIGAHEYD